MTKHIKLLMQVFLIFSVIGLSSCKAKQQIGRINIEVQKSTVLELSYLEAEQQQPWGGVMTGVITGMNKEKAPFEQYGFPKSVKETYTEEWFQTHSLIMIIMATNSSYDYSVSSVELSDAQIEVGLNEIIPRASTDLKGYKAVLIEVPRDSGISGEKVTVNFKKR